MTNSNFQLPAQSIQLQHFSYPLRHVFEGLIAQSSNVTDSIIQKAGTPTKSGVTEIDWNEVQRRVDTGDFDVVNFLMGLIDCMKCDYESKFAAIGQMQIFAADTCQTNMDVLNLSSTTILWEFVTLANSVINYNAANGVFTPLQAGYYRVDSYFRDTHGNPSGRMSLNVTSTVLGSSTELDRYGGTTADRLSGWKIFYCNGYSDTFSVAMSNLDSNGTMRFRDMTSGEHQSRVTVQYLGNYNSVTY